MSLPGASEPSTRPGDVLASAVGMTRPHLIGVGGAGMSALARLLAAGGLDVRGVDSTETPVTGALRASGIAVEIEPPAKQSGERLAGDRDGVIASAAVGPDHAQLIEAQRRGLEILSYPEALGRCMGGRTGVAIAGTHGKSTTSAMLGCALADAGLDPSVIVGATSRQLGAGALAPAGEATGFRLGGPTCPRGTYDDKPGLLIAEACEYDRSFHNLRPVVAAIGSVEADHLDIYGTLDEVIESFAAFARLVPDADAGGRLLIAHEGAHRIRITAGLRCAIETIGFTPSADWRVSFDAPGGRVSCAHAGRGIDAAWVNAMPGAHNAMNSAVAFALACTLGADAEVAARSLGAFAGLDRRLQKLGVRDHVTVYDDYGHHPTEIDATLRAIREADDPARRGGKLILVFQPHQHSRTRHLLEEFATSFEAADVVVVPHIYFVRDSQAERQKVSAADLVDRLRSRGVRAMHLYPFEAIVEQLENTAMPGDTVVVMGAGPVWQVAHQYLGLEGGTKTGGVS
ncbi:MAG: cyanophycin synthetase [Planctomycetota bacterium]